MTSWLVDTFQMEPGWARGIGFFIAVIIVLALIAIFVWVLRRIASTRALGGRSRQPRIAVMDAAALDTRRRLVLIRRDNVEHLILVGGPSDVVVEQNIVRGVPVSQSYPRQPMPGFAPPPMESPAVPAEPTLEPAPPSAAPQMSDAPQAPAQGPAPTPQRAPDAPRGESPRAPSPARPAPSQPRAPMPPRPAAPRPQQGATAASDSASPLRRAGTSAAAAGTAVAAAGAAVAGLAKRTATRASDMATSSSRSEASARPEPPARTEPPVRRSLTPPSSGPAANARTAYPQAGSAPSGQTSSPEAARRPVSTPSSTLRAPQTSQSGTTAGATAAASLASATPAARPSASGATDATVGASEVKPPVPEAGTNAEKSIAPSVAAPEPKAAPREVDTVLEDALLAELGGGAEPSSTTRPRSEPVVSEPAAKVSPAAKTETADPARLDATPATESAPKAEDMKVSSDAEAQPGTATPEPDKKDNGGAAETRDGSMDAIEEEMARLLNEINGSRKS